MMKNVAVIGANYGDESKGRSTDYVVKNMLMDGLNPIVIRYSGSNNATHTVYLNKDNYHAFSNIGSGSYRNAPTYLSSFFIVDPVAFEKELNAFKRKFKDFNAEIYIDPQCRFVTPYDVALNRLKEQVRNTNKHGSTGNGLNECIQRQDTHPFYVSDCDNALEILGTIQEYFVEQFKKLEQELDFAWNDLPDDLQHLIKICLDSYYVEIFFEKYLLIQDHKKVIIGKPDLSKYNCVFEGSQGLALDEDYPNFPYVTRAKTGVHNILKICTEFGIELTDVYYLSRCYMSRHGFDPNFNAENHHAVLDHFDIVDVTNIHNDWQGSMVFDYLDYDGLEQRITDDFTECRDQFPHCTQHRVFSCIDQLKKDAPFKAWIYGKLESFPSFEHFHTAYYGNHDIGSFVQFRSAIN
jgi:adenylosuccinate synthase